MIIFIIFSTTILILLNQYGLLEKYFAFALIPILTAYFSGQFVERKFSHFFMRTEFSGEADLEILLDELKNEGL
jgi:hypothetical protein